jgi:hypothetical protein
MSPKDARLIKQINRELFRDMIWALLDLQPDYVKNFSLDGVDSPIASLQFPMVASALYLFVVYTLKVPCVRLLFTR